MSPRPRAMHDDAILDAASRVLDRIGPSRLRLEDVAREIGLSPSTLVLRFGSKRGLLLAVAERGVTSMSTEIAARRAIGTSPMDLVADVGACLLRFTKAPQLLANSLAFLQLSLEDEEFRQLTRRNARALTAEIRGLLTEAAAAGELADCSIPDLARAILAMTRGSLLTWSASGTRMPADKWVRGDLETLLRPYRASPPARRAGRRRPAAAGRSDRARAIRH